MMLRRAFFRWLFPAAIILPLWLLVGWGVFQAGGWSFLWVLFIAIPSVFVGQLVLAFLVRARPSVRVNRAVSWLDVIVFSVWHTLIIAVGCFVERWFPIALVCAIAAGVGAVWATFYQFRLEAVAHTQAWGSESAQSYRQRYGQGAGGFARPGETLIVTDAPDQTDDPDRDSEEGANRG
jgi:hypothetical protein